MKDASSQSRATEQPSKCKLQKNEPFFPFTTISITMLHKILPARFINNSHQLTGNRAGDSWLTG